MLVSDNYLKVIDEISKATTKAVKNAERKTMDLEELKLIALNEQNQILKQIGLCLAQLVDVLGET